VAWYDDGDFIVPDSTADSLSGHAGKTSFLRKLCGDLSIGCSIAIRDFQKDIPHRNLEG